jgi:hypothetical protein
MTPLFALISYAVDDVKTVFIYKADESPLEIGLV